MAHALLTVMVESEHTDSSESVQARVAELLSPHQRSNSHRNPDWTWEKYRPAAESPRFRQRLETYEPGDCTYAFLSSVSGWHESGEAECGDEPSGDDWGVRFRGLYDQAAANCEPFLYEYQG